MQYEPGYGGGKLASRYILAFLGNALGVPSHTLTSFAYSTRLLS